jgi:hypothetical protein
MFQKMNTGHLNIIWEPIILGAWLQGGRGDSQRPGEDSGDDPFVFIRDG